MHDDHGGRQRSGSLLGTEWKPRDARLGGDNGGRVGVLDAGEGQHQGDSPTWTEAGTDSREGNDTEQTGEGAAALLRLGGTEEQQEHRHAGMGGAAL